MWEWIDGFRPRFRRGIADDGNGDNNNVALRCATLDFDAYAHSCERVPSAAHSMIRRSQNRAAALLANDGSDGPSICR